MFRCGNVMPLMSAFVTVLISCVSAADFALPIPGGDDLLEQQVQPIGEAKVWDFTAQVLPEGTLRKGAKIENGLVPTTLDMDVPGGFAVKGPGFVEPAVTATGTTVPAAGAYQLPEAFLFQAEIVPGLDWPEGTAAHRSNVLWDCMYVTYITDPENQTYHRGIQVLLNDCGNGAWEPVLYAGFGRTTESVRGPRAQLKPGQTVNLSFFFDANRSVVWNFAGQTSLGMLGSAGTVVTSKFAPVIGDRFGSNYCAFSGCVKRVAITPCRRHAAGIAFTGRTAFNRAEENAHVTVRIENYSTGTINNIQIKGKLTNTANTANSAKTVDTDKSGSTLPWQGSAISKEIPQLVAGEVAEFECPVETRVQPGWYTLTIDMTARDSQGQTITTTQNLRLGIGPIFAERFPALIWMFNNRPYEEVLDFGFTHGLTGFGFSTPNKYGHIANSSFDTLDRALVEGFRLVKTVGVDFPPEDTQNKPVSKTAAGSGASTAAGSVTDSPAENPTDKYMRTNRDGTIRRNAKGVAQKEVSNPVLQDYARQTARVNAETFGSHPAFGGILPNSEVRDGTFPSFRTEAALYKSQTGFEVPVEVVNSTAPRSIAPTRFPDGIVPDNDPLLHYYRWVWSGGDGWPTIHSALAEQYRAVAGSFLDGSAEQQSRPFFSFYDPAVRVPARWGAGGAVDVLSQWVYAVPEPLAVAGPVEELFAMAAGKNQAVMIMTQIICYRSQIAPKQIFVAPQPEWVVEKPDADFPTIPPDSLQEATWAMIAKPVKGIMYHGYACIAETGAMTGYTYTNSQTPQRMKSLLTGVVAPLGPTLNHLPRKDSPVAVLESFTSTVFAGHGTWGWIAPDLTFFQRARLDPRVIYEETIMRDGFGNARILYAPQCDYLPAPVVEKIRQFQADGGILIGDEFLCKALKADYLVPVNKVARPTLDSTEEVDKMIAFKVNDKARQFTEQAKQKSLADVAVLREQLKSVYQPAADSSSPELITFARHWDGVDYLFVINDHRTFGDYVGQWGMTMEKGLPFEGAATMADPDQKIGSVYELSRGEQMEFTRTADGRVSVPLKYQTNDGRLLLFLPEPIASVKLDAPEFVHSGSSFKATFTVLDAQGKLVHALLPVEVRLFDAAGTELDGGGYLCAVDGWCQVEFKTNLNDAPGDYKITCKDRASGLTAEKTISVK